MDELSIKYIPLDDAVLWDRNPKRHDIGALITSIWRYGFQDPPKFDATLEAIVYGNGRLEALASGRAAGKKPPRGIGLDEAGRWIVPIVFGVDQASRALAEAFAVDHNNLTLAGGGFTAIDMARLWSEPEYLALVESLATEGEPPVTVDGDDLDAMLAYFADQALTSGADGEIGDDEADEGGEVSDGSLLALVDVTIDDPRRVPDPGDVWSLGHHVLACVDVIEGWPEWVKLLKGDMLFLPYPGPLVAVSRKGLKRAMLLVQPDPYIAGHIIDRFVDIYGENAVRRVGPGSAG